MSRITAIKIGTLVVPLKDVRNCPFILTRMSGLSDVVFTHAEAGADRIYTFGGGRDIVLVFTIKPGLDFHSARRLISGVAPLERDVLVTILLDDGTPHAQTVCKVRNSSSDFSTEIPTIALELESVYTCLSSSYEAVIDKLPFGLSAQLPSVTHDNTPVRGELSLVNPFATWYTIKIGSDWLTINMAMLRVYYGVEAVSQDAFIRFSSDPDDFYIELVDGDTVMNIETLCEVGPNGFQFIPNEDMIVHTEKIPSALSGERLSLSCTPRLSGV